VARSATNWIVLTTPSGGRMTPEQYQYLLHELAHVAGLPYPMALMNHGRLKIGDVNAVLVYEPQYDPGLMQARLMLGCVPQELKAAVMEALLEANYFEGYGGECVFSLSPQSGEIVLSAHELWQALSDVARHGSQMWETIMAECETLHAGLPADFHDAMAQHA
jgi:hypothetical protein